MAKSDLNPAPAQASSSNPAMTRRERPPVRFQSYLIAFAVIASFQILAHGTLLNLPYFWDEAGQFVPAALDIFHQGAWVPVSTLPNVHPPAVMGWLAAVWTVFGYSISATRLAMLLVSSAAGLTSFLLAIELSRGAPGTPPFSALGMLCLSPLFFAQAMLAQLDVPAMCFSALALLLFIQDRIRSCAVVCAALVMVKETGAIAPALFLVWLTAERRYRDAAWFVLPFIPLAGWIFHLHRMTGHWLGNSEFASYNARLPFSMGRVFMALLRRLYFLFAGSGHFIGTATLIWAWRRMPLLKTRPWKLAAAFAATNIVFMSVLGGAVLERYMLPVLPVLYAAFAVSLQAIRKRFRRPALAATLAMLALANFINPPYPFPLENNLSFVSFIQLEQSVAAAVELNTSGLVAAPFPISDALRKPELGFIGRPVKVFEIPGFTRAETEQLRLQDPSAVIVWHRTWDPLGMLRFKPLEALLTKYADYKPELTTQEICDTLYMHVTWKWERRGMKMELLQRGATLHGL